MSDYLRRAYDAEDISSYDNYASALDITHNISGDEARPPGKRASQLRNLTELALLNSGQTRLPAFIADYFFAGSISVCERVLMSSMSRSKGLISRDVAAVAGASNVVIFLASSQRFARK